MRTLISSISFSIILFAFISCNNDDKNSEFVAKINEKIELDKDSFQLKGDTSGFDISIEKSEFEPGINIIEFKMSSEQARQSGEIRIEWSFPMADIQHYWVSNISVDKTTFWSSVNSRASSQVPLISFLNNGDKNRLTFALSDALNKIRSGFYLKEEDARIHCSLTLFSEPLPAFTDYTLQIRVDTRVVPYYQSIKECTAWWENMDAYKPATVPDDARLPMYSTWYSFHQNLDVGEVIEECRLGKQMGLESVIVDDGWQTMDSQRGYAFTGDWEPERIGDMKAFVDSIHDIGMKFLLWYSLPFIGEKSGSFQKFQGKYLHHWESQGTWVLDPRYPEVREHIIGTYEKALIEWNLDGFKLDFLGWFYADEETDMTAKDGRDYASVNDALDRLMTDIMNRLKAIRPDIMIEFRQPYIGPLMRKYGNMFRAADCPNMADINRVRTTDLRLSSGNTAVHSDMFMWHPDDPVHSAALQILDVLFSVPQLSVRLNSIPEDHFQMAKNWIRYWKANRHILLDGEFIPKNPGALYPVLISKTDEKTITGLYNDMFLKYNEIGNIEMDIINAKSSQEIVILCSRNEWNYEVIIYDCMGNKVNSFEQILIEGGNVFKVPPSGMLSLVKI